MFLLWRLSASGTACSQKHMFSLTIFLVSSPTRVLLSIYRPKSCRSTPGPETKTCCIDAIARPDGFLCFYGQYAYSILSEWLWPCDQIFSSPLFFFHRCRLRSLVKLPSRPKCSLVLWRMTYALTFCKFCSGASIYFPVCVISFKINAYKLRPRSYNCNLNIGNVITELPVAPQLSDDIWQNLHSGFCGHSNNALILQPAESYFKGWKLSVWNQSWICLCSVSYFLLYLCGFIDLSWQKKSLNGEIEF